MSSYKCCVNGLAHNQFGDVEVYLDAYHNILIIGAKGRDLDLFRYSLQDFVREHFGIEIEVYFNTESMEGWTHAICE